MYLGEVFTVHQCWLEMCQLGFGPSSVEIRHKSFDLPHQTSLLIKQSTLSWESKMPGHWKRVIANRCQLRFQLRRWVSTQHVGQSWIKIRWCLKSWIMVVSSALFQSISVFGKLGWSSLWEVQHTEAAHKVSYINLINLSASQECQSMRAICQRGQLSPFIETKTPHSVDLSKRRSAAETNFVLGRLTLWPALWLVQMQGFLRL